MNGILELSRNILCKGDVLGKGYDVIIAGQKAKLLFPRVPPMDKESLECVGLSNPLLPPKANEDWKRGKESINWGYPFSYPDIGCVVENLEVEIDYSGNEAEKIANAICDSITTWEHSFIDYLRICTKQEIERNRNEHQKNCNFQLIDGDAHYSNISNIIYMSQLHPEECATEDQIVKAIQFANSGKELFLEYQMLLSSYHERQFCKNRPAILDACSAIEKCLANYIEEQCLQRGLDAKWFLEQKFRSLGDRIKLAGNFDPTFHVEEYLELVSKPRNDIMHNRNVFPSDETTDKLIHCVENCLEHFLKDVYY